MIFLVAVVAGAYLYLSDGVTFWRKTPSIAERWGDRGVGKSSPTRKQHQQTKPEDEEIPFYEPQPTSVGWISKDPKSPWMVHTSKPEGYIAELDGIGGTVKKIEGDVITLVDPEIGNSMDRAAQSARWRVRIDNPAVKVFKFTGDFSSGNPWTEGTLADLAPGARAGFIWAKPRGSTASFTLYEINIELRE
ncbi:MAG: hypothetical protein WA148_05510 [Actinomycetota bacterium]